MLPPSQLAIHWSLINLWLQRIPVRHKAGACCMTDSSNALYITFIYIYITQAYETQKIQVNQGWAERLRFYNLLIFLLQASPINKLSLDSKILRSCLQMFQLGAALI